MARDKAKDDELFNCSEQHEIDYVVGLYPVADQDKVNNIITKACTNSTFSNSTHKSVFDHIDKELK